MSSLDDKLAAKKFPHRDVHLCIDGELATERERTARDLSAAVARKTDRLANPDVARLRKELADLDQRVKESSITIRIYGVSFGEYNAIRNANPPRKGHQEAFNPITFFVNVARKTGKYVDDDGEHDIAKDQWDKIEAALTDAEHDKIATAVVAVNRTDNLKGIDFLGNGSDATTDSSETSEPLETSG